MSKSAVLPVQPGEAPTTEFGTVVEFPHGKQEPWPEREDRREWLTEAEVEKLCAAARKRGRCDIVMRR